MFTPGVYVDPIATRPVPYGAGPAAPSPIDAGPLVAAPTVPEQGSLPGMPAPPDHPVLSAIGSLFEGIEDAIRGAFATA